MAVQLPLSSAVSQNLIAAVACPSQFLPDTDPNPPRFRSETALGFQVLCGGLGAG